MLTGCKAKYNLQINFGGNFVETGTVYFNSNLLGKGDFPTNRGDFLDKLVEKYDFEWINKKVSFDEGNYFGYKFYHRYPNAGAYGGRSPALKTIFNSISVEENNHYVKLNSLGYNNTSSYHQPTADVPTTIEEIEINISLPYRVVKHNASYVDADTNTYTWTFNSQTPNTTSINLEYRNNELYTYNPAYLLKFVSPYVYIALILIIVILVIAANARTKSRLRNRI